MRLSHIVLLITIFTASVLAAAPVVHAQTTATAPATPPATGAASRPATGPEKSPADLAFEPLAKAMRNLIPSLRNGGGVHKEDEPTLRSLRDRAVEFSRQFPSDPRGPAVELQISIWLNDDAAFDALYDRLAKLLPDNTDIPLGRADYLINHNQFPQALAMLQAGHFDPAKAPRANVLLSDALFAEERFKEAVDSLRAIPQDVVDKDGALKLDVESKLTQRQDCAEEWAAEQAIRATEAFADDLPRATIKTSRGEITLELFENQASNTVANFVSLADRHFYEGTKFHRVLPNFMAQGGDPNSKDGATGTPGQGNPGYYIPDEVSNPEFRKHFTGSLSMAKTAAPNSGGCQFFITVTPTPHLNGQHTVFGRVLTGLDIVRNLQQNDVIESITITRRRNHAYVPTTLPAPGASTPPTPPAQTQPLSQAASQPESPPASQPSSAPASSP